MQKYEYNGDRYYNEKENICMVNEAISYTLIYYKKWVGNILMHLKASASI